ncbi:MAG: recombinase RecB [Desulfurococcales archaeon ex4484_58]|nr:MAG: recombinase RecB [Desulfurococcales archaeon ex4484_58]
MRYAILYAPSSVQKVLDFIKTIYVFEDFIPVIVKPIGAGAQIGVPEAYKYAYRIGKPLIILPGLTDLRETLHIINGYYLAPHGEEIEIDEIIKKDHYALIFTSEGNEPSKKELTGIRIVKVKGIPPELPTPSLAAILLYLIKQH